MTGSRASAAVDRLVAAGLLDPARAGEAETIVRGALDERTQESAPLRRRMAEIAGYVGAAFVVGAAWLFLSQTWSDLGLAGQVGLLLVSAVALAAGGLLLARAAGRSAEADPFSDIRGRLASVLLAGSGVCAAFGAGIWVDDVLSNTELVVALAALTGLVVVLAGYVVLPSPVGQVAAAFAAFVLVPAGLGALPSESTSPVPLSLSVLALGAVWLLLAERRIWREQMLGRLLGCALAFVGAQMALPGDHSWVAYVATAAVGVLAFGLYVVTRAWPYLLTGVLAVTVAVPEALYDWAEGSLGAAGILLVTGVTLLVAALAGLRLRQEVTS
jgi:hypothetical protein